MLLGPARHMQPERLMPKEEYLMKSRMARTHMWI